MELDEDKKKEYLRKAEAAMFVAGRWLNIQDLVMLTDLNPILLRQLMDELKNKYEESDTAIKIVDRDDKWKMDVEDEYANIVNKLATGNSEFTKAEQETLAVIAYKEPVKQSVIVKIRGNKAYNHVKKFVELELVKAKKAGRTKELSLSDEFYDYFHLKEKE